MQSAQFQWARWAIKPSKKDLTNFFMWYAYFRSVHDFKGNPNLQPAANVMNPIFNQLGAPNPFAGMGMNPMQMMHTNPGMNPMMGGGPTGVNPGNPAMMMNSMMGGGGMPPNMMGSGGNPNFMGNPMNQNPQSFMGQS